MINAAAVTYSITYSANGFPALLTNLGGATPCVAFSVTACLIDDSLAQGVKGGYSFVWTGDGNVPSVAFSITGTPQVIGASGQQMYCTDQSSVIHYDPSGAGCTLASLVLQ